jgi:hypothetical protein
MPVRHLIHHVGVFASDFAASESFYTSAFEALEITAGYRTETIAEYWIPEHDAPSLSLETAPSNAQVTRGLHLASRLLIGALLMPSIEPPSSPVVHPGTSRDIGPSTGPTLHSSVIQTATTSRPW